VNPSGLQPFAGTDASIYNHSFYRVINLEPFAKHELSSIADTIPTPDNQPPRHAS
jgi:hypothetical protein